MSDGEAASYRFAPVTPATQEDLARFSRAYGKFRYCSCLRWRLRSTAFRDATDRPGLLAGLVAQAVPGSRRVGGHLLLPRAVGPAPERAGAGRAGARRAPGR